MPGDDIFPSLQAPSDTIDSVSPVKRRDDPDELAERSLRWAASALLFQVLCVVMLLAAWAPGGNIAVEWIYIEYYNGSPAQGQNVGLVSGDLVATTVDSLGWNGAPFSWTDAEEADVACAGPLITSDVCMGLQMKMTCHGIYDFLVIMNLACLLPAIAFTSWIVHQLRFGLVLQSAESASVGYYGCITQSAQWWLDPCTYVILQAVCVLPGILIGLPAWPIAMLLMRDKFVGLGGLWWGGAQTIFGVQGVVTMGPGYELYAISTVFFIPLAAFLTVKLRDTYRALCYGGGVDSSEDATAGYTQAVFNSFSHLGAGLANSLSYLPQMSWGAGEGAGAGAGAGAAGGGATAAAAPAAAPALPQPRASISGASATRVGAGGSGGSSPPLPLPAPQAVPDWGGSTPFDDDSDSPFGNDTLSPRKSSTHYDDSQASAFAPSKVL